MGFFKKLVKGIGKVAKFVAPAVVAVAKTAAKHTVVGQVLTGVAKVKKLTAAGAAANAHARQQRSPAYAAATAGPPTKAKRKPKAKRGSFAAWVKKAKKQDAYAREAKSQGLKRTKRRTSAKQAAARARFARAAKKGRIMKGAKL